ncbi:MAG: hypothetical protein ACMXYL_01645 [Candidatus Woesearchaeota archaeon]
MVNFNELDKTLKAKGIDLDRMTDGVGTVIDQKIKPLLYVLNLRGYETTSSCEGHPIAFHKNRIMNNE